MNGVLTSSSESVTEMMQMISSALNELEELAQDVRLTLDGEQFLTDRELSDQLKISTRKLATMRGEGKISFIKLDGKILYKASDILKMLEANYNEAWNE